MLLAKSNYVHKDMVCAHEEYDRTLLVYES